jgi:hypothetical protein
MRCITADIPHNMDNNLSKFIFNYITPFINRIIANNINPIAIQQNPVHSWSFACREIIKLRIKIPKLAIKRIVIKVYNITNTTTP